MNKNTLTQKFISGKLSMNAGAQKLADRYNLTKEEVYEAKLAAKTSIHTDDIVGCLNAYSELENKLVEVHNELGTLKSSITSDEDLFSSKSDLDLAKLHKVDLTKYKIVNYWTKVQPNGKFTSSLFCKVIAENSEENITNKFAEALTAYVPKYTTNLTPAFKNNYENCCLIIPKQDSHFNKYDIMGDNDINNRFSEVQVSIINDLQKASLSNNVEEVVYIVGSDQFNSEWTSLTTKGTPQTNILTYQESFRLICDHEIQTIVAMLEYSDRVKIVFVPGNHDEFVGWHLIHFLEMYFREVSNVTFDTSTLNTKYHKYRNCAIMLNHGDAIKPKELAQKFPRGFKEEWSSCDFFYIFTGDKHHELSLDIHGIKFYQVPQLSKATSKWDDKQGYIDGRAEMQVFNLSQTKGMTDIYKTIF